MEYLRKRNMDKKLDVYLKNLPLEPNSRYTLTLEVLGGVVDVFIGCQGIVSGSGIHFTEPCRQWMPVSIAFSTGDDREKLMHFSDWGIGFCKRLENPLGSGRQDTYVDNVHLYKSGDGIDLLNGGTFESPLSSPVYHEHWRPEVLGPTGITVGVRIVEDPCRPGNHCLKLPRLDEPSAVTVSGVEVLEYSRCRLDDWDITQGLGAREGEYSLFVVESGVLKLDNGTVMSSQTALLLPCETAKNCIYGKGGVYYRVDFSGEALQPLLAALNMPFGQPVPVAHSTVLTVWIDRMLSLPAESELYAYATVGYLYSLLFSLEQQRHFSVSSPHHEALMAVAARLRESPETETDNDSLAAMCGISRNHFIQLFKKEFGYTPQQYRLRETVRKACSLLETTEMTVTQISYAVGVEDPLYFSRLFRTVRGLSPRQYREQYRR